MASTKRGSIFSTRLRKMPSFNRVDVLSSLVARRTGREPAEVYAALADGPVTDSEALVRPSVNFADLGAVFVVLSAES